MRALHKSLILSMALLLTPLPLLASGTYRGGPPRQPSSVDREAYDQGKRVFTGDAVVSPGAGDAETQRARLADWQKRLPQRVQDTTDLTALAGQLSDEQLKQLGYYLEVRYKIK